MGVVGTAGKGAGIAGVVFAEKRAGLSLEIHLLLLPFTYFTNISVRTSF